MTAEQNSPDGSSPSDGDMQNELEKTLAEAEAAVDAVKSAEADDLEEGEPDGPAEDPVAAVAALEEEVASLKDRWLRAVADLDNQKKRTRREIDEAILRRTQDLLKGFLPTVDNLERALEVSSAGSSGSPEEQLGQLVKGIEMVRDEFIKALSFHGIEPVPSVGSRFDPNIHDALQQFDSPDHAPGVIIREFEKGYQQGDRLMRPSRVIVAGPGSSGPEPEEDT